MEDDTPNITDQPFNNLINNRLHVRVRQEMESGIQPKECRRCYASESNNIVSYRQEQNYVHQHRKVEVGLKYLDVRFNNTCNLKCIMCSSNYSSLWVEDERKLATNNSYFADRVNFYNKNSYKWSIENDVVESIKQNSHSLERIHFAGGEPLLSKQHNELLHYLIDSGVSKNLMISYNTNITLIDENVIKLWNQFKHVKVFLSIDGIGPVLEYVRYPIKYTDILTVFELMDKQSNSNIKYVMHYTVNALNLLHLPEFIEYKINLPYNISPGELFTIDTVFNPPFLSVNVLPKKLIDHVDASMATLQDKYPEHNTSIQSIRDKVLASHNTQIAATLEDTISYCKELDVIRGTDSSFITQIIQTYV